MEAPSSMLTAYLHLILIAFCLLFSAQLCLTFPVSASGYAVSSVPTSNDLHSAELQQQQQQQPQGGRKLWCVANPSTPDEKLIDNLNFACGQGGVNCMALDPGGSCHDPNTLLSHASYAMNRYYQAQGRNYWNCDFHSTGLVVFTDPSYGNCIYPPQ